MQGKTPIEMLSEQIEMLDAHMERLERNIALLGILLILWTSVLAGIIR